MQGRPSQTGHSEEFWQNVIHWRRKWQPTPVSLPGENNEQHEKGKKDMISENEPPGHFATGSAQFTTGEEQRGINNSSAKNEVDWPKQK